MRPLRSSGSGAARIVAIPVGESPTDRRGPVTVVVVSSSEKGDRLGESLDVKALVAGRNPGQIRRGASDLTGRSECEPVSLEIRALLETDGRINGRAEPLRSR